MYATPVVYPLSVLSERYRAIALLNPATGIIEAFRGTILGTPIPLGGVLWSVVASVLCLLSGAFYFRRMERLFADVI
jgi:lipopolysaccharide transport system permease protein